MPRSPRGLPSVLQVSKARVRTPNPCQPPALALPRDRQVLAPGRRCHLPVSGALQASREALLGAAKLLKRRQLRKLLETEQTWRVAERLVRTAPKPHRQPGEAPLPRCPACGAGSCAPAPLACSAHGLPFPPRHPGVPRWALAAGWHRSTPGSTLSSAPSKAQHWPAAGWTSWVSGHGKVGEASLGLRGSSAPTRSPRALTSWRRTAGERRSTWTRACRTCRAHRNPCARQPSSSLVSHEPAEGPSLPTDGLAPATAAAESAGRLQSPDCLMRVWAPTGLPAALSHSCPRRGGWREPRQVPSSLLGLHAHGTALGSALPKGRRAHGQSCGAGWGELGRWGGQASGICDGLCVPRARWAAAEGWAPGEAAGHPRG